MLHRAKRKSETAGSETGQSASFIHHTNELCNKTGRQVNDLKRLCHHISPDVKISELLSRSINSTAQQYGTIAQYQTLKKNQELALRYITNDYKSDYRSLLLCQTSLHSLEEGRQQQIAIQTFKMINNLSPPYLQGLITTQKYTRIHRNYVKALEIHFYNRVRHGTNSFSFFGT